MFVKFIFKKCLTQLCLLTYIVYTTGFLEHVNQGFFIQASCSSNIKTTYIELLCKNPENNVFLNPPGEKY